MGEPAPPGDHLTAELQRLEDVRLAAPFAAYDTLPELHRYRRRPGSTVWHAHPRCPAWPAAAPYTEQVGEPAMGEGCGVCLTHGVPL